MADRDIWYRPITNKRHINKDNKKLTHAALKGRAILPPEYSRSKWKSEISGRLRSIARSISEVRAEAEQRVKKIVDKAKANGQKGTDFVFMGVAHTRGASVRAWTFEKSDLLYDPRLSPKSDDFDLAHSNLAFFSKPPAVLTLSALDEIIEQLKVIREGDLDDLPSTDCRPPWSYNLFRLLFRRIRSA